jgi:hydroxyacylglutathione hydrolase
MSLDVLQFPCLDDNYGFLARCSKTGACAAIDTPEPARILEEARANGWRISEIWNTHHHWDHAGGNATVAAATQARITAPMAESDAIGAIDRPVSPGDTIRLGEEEALVLDVGGHTLGHVAYWFRDARVCFVGDSLFALGCGRLFEGSPAQAQASLARLRALPDDTLIYCAHEYTAANAAFALSVDPENAALRAYADEVSRKRAAGEPTVPTTISREKAANPFLRWDDGALRAQLGLADASDAAVFAKVRELKDMF